MMINNPRAGVRARLAQEILNPDIPLPFSDLTVLAYRNGFTWWHYPAASGLRNVLAPGFFNEASGLLAAGDRISVIGDGGAVDLHVAGVVDKVVSVAALQATPGALA
jgi:hypothetical protein